MCGFWSPKTKKHILKGNWWKKSSSKCRAEKHSWSYELLAKYLLTKIFQVRNFMVRVSILLITYSKMSAKPLSESFSLFDRIESKLVLEGKEIIDFESARHLWTTKKAFTTLVHSCTPPLSLSHFFSYYFLFIFSFTFQISFFWRPSWIFWAGFYNPSTEFFLSF
jgi:hypothetical protein